MVHWVNWLTCWSLNTHQAGVYRLLFLLFCFNRHTPTPPPNPPSPLPSLLCSPLVHPHKSLMMCRLHRAGLSNDIITISKSLLLPYGPTSCGMLYRAGRCTQYIYSIILLYVTHFRVCRLCIASIKEKASMLCVYALRINATCQCFKQKPSLLLVNYMADTKWRMTERSWITSGPSGDTFYTKQVEHFGGHDSHLIMYRTGKRGPHGAGGDLAAPQLEVFSFKYCWTQTHTQT